MQTEESFYSNDNVDVTMFNFLTPRKVGYLRSEERVLFYGARRSSSNICNFQPTKSMKVCKL